MTLNSEISGEIEKPGRMIDTQAFIEDDHPGLPNTCYASGFVSKSLPELCVAMSVRFKIPLGAYSMLKFSLFKRQIIGREAGKIKREGVLDFPS